MAERSHRLIASNKPHRHHAYTMKNYDSGFRFDVMDNWIIKKNQTTCFNLNNKHLNSTQHFGLNSTHIPLRHI